MIDSHCHLDRLKIPQGETLDDSLDRAAEEGVDGFLNVCIDLENFDEVLRIANSDNRIYASVGVHPNEMEMAEPTLDDLLQRAENLKVVAIGETGLDYHYVTDAEKLEQQRNRFRTHISAAKECNKPLIIHTREAREDTIRIMREEGVEQCGGVMHCFTENWEMASQALDLGFYVSFSGIITFNSAAKLREVVKQVPQDRLLIETDSPYLAPVPYRGKPNQPAYVRQVAEKVAELRGWSIEEVDRITTENFQRLFRL
ncbi:MAG: TatD family hydrolase [Gammaproteobacteria bacterium]|uniref:TatD family hydrolase n=1 Tax=Candidatus Thiopontia autotrophica TaxID=2841688 RepID=A0A8J6P2P9_9GAMM|nr:TatD family hydrolase [Candidatus Thiopontia autotrophica]